jgi:hypothetical protein
MLVSRERARRTDVGTKGEQEIGQAGVSRDLTPVNIKDEIKEEEPLESRTVLTLYGTAQGPKQLFSSLQQPVSVPPTVPGSGADRVSSVKVFLPLPEASLPNIISTTQVFPLPEDDQKKKSKTFGETFPPPAHLPQLSPPKLAKPPISRGNTITFAPQEAPSTPARKTPYSYSSQNLATGHWLGYGGVDMPKDPTSPTAKQKSRQRALSTGEAQLPPSEATLAAVHQAKEDALFRSVYSSFAPTRDDSTAIIPAETKSKVWWQKVGEKRFHETFPIDPALLESDVSVEAEAGEVVDEAEAFKEAVENFTPADPNPFASVEKSDMEKSTDEVLQEISDLLETLASHQRIRNSSLATNPRTVLHNSSLATLAGSPSSPSSEEIDIYQMLKSQLTLMIAQLPPYAVAKLNGDQLDELNISRTLIIETEDHNGVLEEDQYPRRSTVPTPGAPPPLSRMASMGTPAHSHYPPSSSQYSRNTPSAHQPSARPAQPVQNYYPQQQPALRSPSVHYQRSASNPNQTFQTPAASYGNSTPRQGYGAQYGQQTPRPGYAQAATGQYYSQRPAAPASNYGNVATQQYYQTTPQPQSHRYTPQQAQNGYYQRPQTTASYNYSTNPTVRTGSPMKANPSVAQPGQHSSRAGYGTPVSGASIRGGGYYPQGVAGTAQYATPPPSTPSAATPGGYNTMGSNHQQMMVDRQQAQIAAQSQARLAAQSFNRHGSGTPQPPNPQYNGQQQPNGAPMVA